MFRHRLLTLAILPAAIGLALLQPLATSAGQRSGPSLSGGNNLIDLDRNQPFSINKQNENSITRDPLTGALIAGANDNLLEGPCPGTSAPLASPCPFRRGIGVSGFYSSFDNGQTWSGGILPGTPGRSSGGDPSLDNGPRLCGNGQFNYGCGATIYYANLEDPVDADLHLSEAVGVARSYDDGRTWATPVEVTSVTKSQFDDHEWLAVDKSASSPHFGRVYVFWAVFCASCAGNGNVKLYVAHSDDEALHWSAPVQVSQTGSNNAGQGGRETGQMAVASDGTVEAFWSEDEDTTKTSTLQVVAASTDGGNTFSNPITIAPVTDYPLRGTPFDVVDLFNRVPGMSARVDCFPHPAADPSSTKVYVVWCDFSNGHGTVTGAVSSNQGQTWTSLGTIASVDGRNAFFPAAAVSPAGLLSVAFDALTAPPADNPWQTGVQTYDTYYVESGNGGGSFTSPLKISTTSSNPDASSYNNLQEQFIGDYIGIVDGPSGAYVDWTDSRNAAQCAAVDNFRNQVYAGSKTAVAPNPDTACGQNFGNTDSMEATVTY